MDNTATVLITEDEVLIQTVVEEGLVDAGFGVSVADNGHDALAKIEADPSSIAAIVTDIHLGNGPTGWEVARRARELRAGVPVVYITAEGGEEWTSHGVPNSVLILKPFAVGQVVTAVSMLMNDLSTRSTE